MSGSAPLRRREHFLLEVVRRVKKKRKVIVKDGFVKKGRLPENENTILEHQTLHV